MHHMDIDITYRKKGRWELLKNATSYTEQFLEAASHETTVDACLPRALKPSKQDEQSLQYTAGKARTNSWETFSDGPLHIDVSVLANQEEHTYNSSVQTQDVMKICCKW